MSWGAEAVPAPTWGKVQKNLCQAHLRVLHHQLESEKKMNQEDFHEKQGQRSAPQSAQKCVFWKATLLNALLEKTMKTRTWSSTTRNWNVHVLLHSPL